MYKTIIKIKKIYAKKVSLFDKLLLDYYNF